ncbi:MAG: hypothetical protein U9O98_04800, partial [Asgard group archaeon]|nr:hypothetical protein [Asgard group archaeon]
MNDTQQMVMYRLAPFFSSLCKKISQLIKTKYTFGKNIPFIIKQKLDELLDVNTFQIQYEEFYAARKITVSQAKIKGSLQFLDKIIKRDLDKAILAILTGKKIVVVGDEAMCKIAIASLEIFSPHKELKKVYWTNQIVNADIIGTTKSLAKAYDDAVIVDLFKGKIRGGSSNKFCKNLHSDLKGLTENLVIRKVNERINEIITSASILAELAMKKKVTKKELSSVAPHFNSERMEIITIIAKSINPIFASRIDKLAPYISREASTYDVFA